MDESRTVVVSGVPDLLPGHRMRDKLTVHFQSRRRSRGGDVEAVEYPTDMEGVAFVTFRRAADAEAVALKEQQILTDAAFPDEYLLTVFPFTTDVFFYVSSADVDLSAFDGDQASLVQSLRAAHRSLRFRTRPRERKATVEGPFSAVRALGEDLTGRARQLQAASVKLGDFPPNPRVISHRGFVGPVSRSHPEAQREPGGSSGLSARLQSAGEGSRVQSQRSHAKTPRSARQSAQSCHHTGAEAEPKAGLRRTSERARAKRAEANSAGPPPENGATQEHAAGWFSATESPTPPDETSSVTARTRLTHMYEGSAGSREDNPDDTCIWVDSYIFRYIEKFEKQYERCLRGVSASAEEAEGSDLVRICLAEEEPSEGPSRVREALANLNTLLERWQSTLRVYQICYDKKEHPKEKVMLICMDVEVKYKYDDVLYVVEESQVKIVGPLSVSYLFYFIVKQRLEWDKM